MTVNTLLRLTDCLNVLKLSLRIWSRRSTGTRYGRDAYGDSAAPIDGLTLYEGSVTFL
jgi:hypothetical protein